MPSASYGTLTPQEWLDRYGSVQMPDGDNGTKLQVRDPYLQKLADIASGKQQLTNFDELFSNANLGISKEEFAMLSPAVQAAARANPQLFLQSAMGRTYNADHGDLLSLGAEGGFRDYGTATWDPSKGLVPDESKYMEITPAFDWGLVVMLAAMGGLAAAGNGLFGAAAQSAVTGAEVSGLVSGGALTEVGATLAATTPAEAGVSFLPSAASNGMLGLNNAAISSSLGLGAETALIDPAIAGLTGGATAITPASLGLTATGGGIMTTAGAAAFDAAIASGAGYESALAAAAAAGGTVGAGGSGLSLAEILSGARTAASALGTTGTASGLGAGGGGGSGSSETTPWAPQQPYLLDIFDEAKKTFDAGGAKYYPGSTVASRSPETLAAEEELLRYANGDARDMTASLSRATQFGLEGVLDPNSNEYLAAAVEGALRPVTTKYRTEVMPAISSEAQKLGAYGGSRHGIADALASELYMQSLGDISSKMYSDAYGKGLDTMTRTMALTPENIKAGTMPASLVANVGQQRDEYAQTLINAAKDRWDYEQEAPTRNLNNYRQMVTGQYGGTTTRNETPVKSNKLLTALGAGLTGGTVGSRIAGMTDGAVNDTTGAGIGATLGLILGSL